MEYGQQYDAALNVLLWELLSKLEKLMPVPDLKQVFSQSIQIFQVILNHAQFHQELKNSCAVITDCNLAQLSTSSFGGLCPACTRRAQLDL